MVTGSVTLLLLMVMEGSPPDTIVAHELNSVVIATMLINTNTFLMLITCFVCIFVFDFILENSMRTPGQGGQILTPAGRGGSRAWPYDS
jgi:hypothetical protein